MALAAIQDRIISTIASMQDEILDFTRQLIAIPTENPPGKSYRECVELIKNKLDEIGMESTMLAVSSDENAHPRYCLSGSHGSGERTLYFHGHYDVVPADHDAQFKPYIKDGNLFGRGSSDMKAGLTAMIYAVKALKACNIELDGRIGLAFVPDEETGGKQGSQYLARTGVLGRDGIGMLTPEPTSGVIWNANRGAISLRVTVKGKPVHVCLQHQGVNAFERMLAVANALWELKQNVESQKTNFHVQPEDARRSILMLGGQSGGGTNFNTLPGECSFTIDRRINPEEDLETEKQRLFALFEKQKQSGIDLEIEILQEGESAGTNEDNPVARSLMQAVEAITGRRSSFELCPGLLETRFYAQQGLPAFAYGPGLLSVSHGPDEYVEIENIYSCAAIYALTAAQVLAS